MELDEVNEVMNDKQASVGYEDGRPGLLTLAQQAGRVMTDKWPAVAHERDKKAYGDEAMVCFIPADRTEEIAEAITAMVAEMLQTWLDAGSERDVTMEELWGPIYTHIKGWGSRS